MLTLDDRSPPLYGALALAGCLGFVPWPFLTRRGSWRLPATWRCLSMTQVFTAVTSAREQLREPLEKDSTPLDLATSGLFLKRPFPRYILAISLIVLKKSFFFSLQCTHYLYLALQNLSQKNVIKKKPVFRDTVQKLARANHNSLVKNSLVIGFNPAEAANWTKRGLDTDNPWLVDERQKSSQQHHLM